MNALPGTFLTKAGGLPPKMASAARTLSPDMQAFIQGTDLEANDNGSTKFVSAYAQSAWVYIAVSVLAENISKIPFRISRVGAGNAKKIRSYRNSSDPRYRQFCRRALNETIIESGDVVDLFNNPHPTMDANLFWEMVVTWQCLRGEFFILPLDDMDMPVDLASGKPRVERMITLPTELFWHLVVGYELEAWRYTGSPLITPIPSEILLPSEVIHSRSPNPYLYWRGMSPLIVADVACRTDYAGEQYAKGLWINNADTGVIVTTEQQAEPAQRAAILAALRERKRKAGTADRPLFLWGGAKVEKPTLTSQDMQFLETRKFLRQEIAAIFKVPESLMGYTDDKASALSGGGQAISAERLQFIEGPIASHCHKIETAMDQLVKVFGPDLVGWFDVDSLPVMQEARRARWDTGTKMFAMGVTLNDINAHLDLGLKKYAWGDKSFLPFNLQEVTVDGLGAIEQQPSEQAEPAPNSDDQDKADAEKSNPFTRMIGLLGNVKQLPAPVIKAPNAAALWRKRMAFRKSHVALFKGKAGKVLMHFRRKTLAKLDEVHLQKDAGQLPASARGLVDLIFQPYDFGAALFNELSQPIASVLQAAGDNMNEEIGVSDPWKYPPKAQIEFIAGRKDAIQGVGGTVRDQLNTSLIEGVDAGETHLELTARVKAVFTDLAKFEAERIARTEVNMASCNGAFQAMSDAGISYKSWLGSHGPHARPEHQAVEDDTIDEPIPVDEPFEVDGEQMMYPLDDSLGAGPGNIINCQCDVLAAEKSSEDEKAVTYKIFGVGNLTFQKK